jgi:hypothetical protein
MTWLSFADGREGSCKESDVGQYPSLLPKPDVCFLVLGAGIEVRSHRVGGQECILHFADIDSIIGKKEKGNLK